jgi:spermidine synthase
LNKDLSGDWIIDRSKKGDVSLLRVVKRLHSSTTSFQKVELVETEAYGRALILDGSIQAAEADEYIYHETLVHPAMLSLDSPTHVAVLGGGEGATIREVLRHRMVEQVTMVDIDREVVEFCRKYLPGFSRGAFEDRRTRLVFDDARNWIGQQAPGSLDAVIVDITEPLEGGPSFLLFTREFYAMVRRVLKTDGVVAVQAGPADPMNHDIFVRVCRTMAAVFDGFKPLISYVPSFNDQWGFVVGFKGNSSFGSPEEVDARLKGRLEGRPRFFDGETLFRITSLPLEFRNSLKNPVEPFTDDDPPGMKEGFR